MGCNQCQSCNNEIQFPEISEELYDKITAEIWDKTPPGLIINLTNDCPLRCKYCFVDFAKRTASLDTLTLFLTRFVEGFYGPQLKDKNPSSLCFFGGEPLMHFHDLIVPIVNQFEGKFTWSITTNGVLLTDEILSFIQEKNFSVILSIDGAPATQNFNRPFENGEGSAAAIEPWLTKISTALPHTVFRSTLIPETVEHLNENIAYARQHGFNHYFCCPDEFSNWSEETNRQKLINATKTLGMYYFSCFSQGYFPMRISMIDRILIHLLQNNGAPYVFRDNQSPMRCGLGIGGWGIGVDGRILGCQEKSSHEDNLFVIGDINGINKTKHIHLIQKYYQEMGSFDRTKCNSCICRTFCFEGLCPSRQIDMGGIFNPTVEKANCIFKQALFEMVMQLDATAILLEESSSTYSKFLDLLKEERGIVYESNNISKHV